MNGAKFQASAAGYDAKTLYVNHIKDKLYSRLPRLLRFCCWMKHQTHTAIGVKQFHDPVACTGPRFPEAKVLDVKRSRPFYILHIE